MCCYGSLQQICFLFYDSFSVRNVEKTKILHVQYCRWTLLSSTCVNKGNLTFKRVYHSYHYENSSDILTIHFFPNTSKYFSAQFQPQMYVEKDMLHRYELLRVQRTCAWFRYSLLVRLFYNLISGSSDLSEVSYYKPKFSTSTLKRLL